MIQHNNGAAWYEWVWGTALGIILFIAAICLFAWLSGSLESPVF